MLTAPRHDGGELTIENRHGDRDLYLPDGTGETIVVRAGSDFGADTFTCVHCGSVVIKHPQRTRPRGYCAKCDQTICDQPGCNADCNPIQQGLELAQAYPTSGPWLARDPRGGILFDTRLRDRRRLH